MNLKSILPILDWLPNYKKDWLKGDISAGITVGVMLVPQGIAYAMIAGLPPIYGLYTALIPQIIYAIFGTSRQLSVGPVAMDSLIVASGVAALAEIGTQNFIEFAILLAFMMGVLQVAFGVFRLGFLVNFLSRPVISGFTSAAALIIGINQFKHLFGIDIGRSNKIQVLLKDTFSQIQDSNLITTTIGIISIIILVYLKKKFKKTPAALVVVVLGLLAVKLFNLDQFGVQIVGSVPEGLPSFKMPSFSKEIIINLAPVALTLSFVGFLEAVSVARAIETKHTEYKVVPNQELVALGLSNMIGSFFQSYPATGGFSRTAVNDQANAKTHLASLISASVIGLTLLFLTPVFYYLPKAVLAAIIIVAVFGLLDFRVPKQLLTYAKRDLVILNITLIITAMVGITEGIISGVLLSLGMLIYKSTKPHIAILGNVPNTHFYRNRKRFKDVIIHENILIVRFDAQLHFANTSYFKNKLQEFCRYKGSKLKFLIIDGESFNSLDSSALFALNEIYTYFKDRQVQLAFTGLKGPVRDKMVKSGLMKKIGEEYFFMSVQDAVDYYETGLKEDTKFYKYTNQANE
ncbi:SulP family inorganic anion transporter [Pontimicrobium aquaticum]|uniref:Solute carrier 26 family protein n=1 Tax=Pontimicrobium aquaticum TaxID=2565367 RepID=A0A4U0EVL3_9FLAO|nr:solute carrier family 26 protein [Pontimicrobium aquaticum]TJY35915.1 solute carrier 26 family protein [Pontimicrobium aquaticum]